MSKAKPLTAEQCEAAREAMLAGHSLSEISRCAGVVATIEYKVRKTGGNNVPLVADESSVLCISGNTIDREPQNGGNGIGYQPNVAYTLTTVDRHAICDTALIRRLTPLECERLQGFPDGWTDLPGASDSARYKALGNSVAIPCVDHLVRGVVLAMAG